MNIKFVTMCLSLLLLSCIKKEEDNPNIGLAELTCYAGEKIFYQVTTKAYKIHHDFNEENGHNWEIDTDEGKIIISGTCIYRPVND